MKRLIFALALTAIAAVTPAAAADAVFGTAHLLGQFILPTGVSFEGVEFGGISGLDYDPKNDVYYGVSDDRAEHGPARFYVLKLKIDAKGVHGLDIVRTVPLKNAAGAEFAVDDIDPESMRFDPDNGHLFWSSEGDARGVPAVYESTTDGALVRQFRLPDYYLPAADGSSGVENNLSFEGLTLSTDRRSLYVSTENALIQDGPIATLTAGSPSRIMRFDLASGAPEAEYVYETGPIFAKSTAPHPANDNGISELLAVDETQFLAMERAYSAGVGNQINIYLASVAGATDVAGKPSIKGLDITLADKRLVLKIGEGDFGLDIDNIECLTFGPTIDGKPTIVIASDNNFNPHGQYNQFAVFTLDGFKPAD